MTKRTIVTFLAFLVLLVMVQSANAQVERHICTYHGWDELAIRPSEMERGNWIWDSSHRFGVRINGLITCYNPYEYKCGLSLSSSGSPMLGYTYQPFPPHEWCEHTFARNTWHAEIRSTDCGGPELPPQFIIICYVPRPSLYEIFMAAVSKFFDRILPGYPGPYPYPGQQSGPPVPTLPPPIPYEVTQ